MSDSGVAAGVTSLSVGVTGLLESPLTGLSDTALLDVLRDSETVSRQLVAVQHRLVTEVLQRGVAQSLGQPSASALLVGLLRLHPAEAAARVKAAKLLGPRRAVTGEALEPEFAQVAAAQADGAISAGHASVITGMIRALPAAVRAEHGGAAETFLTSQAYSCDPKLLGKIADVLAATLDPDGTQDPGDQERRRELNLTVGRDGMGRLTGLLTPEATAALHAILDSLGRPGMDTVAAAPADTAAVDPWTVQDAAEADGTAHAAGTVQAAGSARAAGMARGPVAGAPADTRHPGQRRHDAFHAACLRLLADFALPATGGVPTTIMITIDWADLRTATQTSHHNTDAAGHAADGGDAGDAAGWGTLRQPAPAPGRTAHGDPIPAAVVARLAHNADLVPVFLSDTGGIMAYGRTRRLASKSQRLALFARDRGCTLPGCDRPPSWTQTHHLTSWLNGGTTDLNNLALICDYHHRHAVHLGHTCHMINGRPHWTQPEWQDPEQTPHPNHQHHPEHILSAA